VFTISRVAAASSMAALVLVLTSCGRAAAGPSGNRVPTQPSTRDPETPVAAPLVNQPSIAHTSAAGSSIGETPTDTTGTRCSQSAQPIAPASGPGAVDSAVDLACLVQAAAVIRVLPDDLVPDLAHAEDDYGVPDRQAESCRLASEEEVQAPDCVLGDAAGTLTVALLGDSHALMWAPAFDLIGTRLHWKVILIGKSACPPIDADVYDEIKKVPFAECSAWHTHAIEEVNAMAPGLVVISSAAASNITGKTFSSQEWAAALQRFMNELSVPNARKVVLGSIPYPRLGDGQAIGPQCLAAHPTNVQACSTTYERAMAGTVAQGELMGAKQAGIRRIDPSPWFCSRVCTAVIGNMNVYVHGGHLSTTYATYISGVLQKALEEFVQND
jgi:SGNH domain (fused to AT3 domains)